jgi:hypothetical protein
MNATLIRSVLFAASLTATVIAIDDPISGPATLIRFDDTVYIERGMDRTTVREVFGPASAKLGVDVWVFWDFRALRRRQSEKFDALVVQFTNDKVSLIRLTDSRAVRTLLAQQARKSAGAQVAAK